MKSFFILSLALLVGGGTLSPSFVLAKIPNDPQVRQWSYEDIGAYRAWDVTTGSSNVVVAIIDNGFDSSHPDLEKNVWKNTDEIPGNNRDDDNNGYIDDVWGWNFVVRDRNNNGKIDSHEALGNNNPVPDVSELSSKDRDRGFYNHGTLVAGIIGAVGDNKKAGAGINWNVKLMNLKVLENSGVGDYAPLSRAIRYAVDNGADIINVSAVGSNSSDLEEAVDYAYEHGVALIAAAGNNSFFLNSRPLYPACSDQNSKTIKVLGVSAIDEQHRLAVFSNYGDGCVDITAPGVQIGSTLRYAPEENLRALYSAGWSGTSFATPLVSGAAALLKSIQPNWNAKEIYEALKSTVHKTPPDNETEYTHLYGAGLLQVDKAVEYARSQRSNSVALDGFSVFDLEQGNGIRFSLEGTRDVFSQSFLRKVDFFDTYNHSGNAHVLTVRLFQGEYQVSTYNKAWNRLNRFGIKQTQDVWFALGNFVSAGEPQLVLIPKISGKSLTVYSLDGKKLMEKPFVFEGTPSVVRLLSSRQAGLQQLALVTKRQIDSLSVQVWDHDLKPVGKIIEVQDFEPLFDLDSGDVDGDGQKEFVAVGVRNGTIGFAILDETGNQEKSILTSQAVGASLQLEVGDVNADDRADMIVFSESDALISIWESHGRRLDQHRFEIKGTRHHYLLQASFK